MSYIGLSSCRHAVAALRSAVLPEPQRQFEGIQWRFKPTDFFGYDRQFLVGVQAEGRTSRGTLRYKMRAGFSGDNYRLDAYAYRGWTWHGVSLQSTPDKTVLHKWREGASVAESLLVSLDQREVSQIKLTANRADASTTGAYGLTQEADHLDWRGKEVARLLAGMFAQPDAAVTGARILLPTKTVQANGYYLENVTSALQIAGGIYVAPLNCSGVLPDKTLLAFPACSPANNLEVLQMNGWAL